MADTAPHIMRILPTPPPKPAVAPPGENNTEAYIANVSRLTGIDPDEPIGIPSERPSRWMMVGVAMAIQENGTDSLDYFAMLRGWEMCRNDALK